MRGGPLDLLGCDPLGADQSQHPERAPLIGADLVGLADHLLHVAAGTGTVVGSVPLIDQSAAAGKAPPADVLGCAGLRETSGLSRQRQPHGQAAVKV